MYCIYDIKSPKPVQNRIKNLVSLCKYRYRQNKKKVISILLIIVIIFTVFKFIPKNLRIYFIDVGQGDSCLIITPQNKTILLDGGGNPSRFL